MPCRLPEIMFSVFATLMSICPMHIMVVVIDCGHYPKGLNYNLQSRWKK